jgi:hypothetical protein
MDPNPELTKLAYQVLEELVENFPPPRMSYGPDYDLIELPEGYEKPPKEEFEAKLQELMAAQPLKELRTKRNTVLDQSDKYATIDYPHATPEKKQEWLDYRQALRDLPSVTEDPANPVWPTAPTS